MWPQNTVRWFYSSSGRNVNASTIKAALDVFNAKIGGCVKFEQIFEESGNYVKVVDGGYGSCYSSVGMTSGAQDLSLGEDCDLPAIIQHEFMHALGFMHEQNRPDRDSHITVVKEKIDKNYCALFKPCTNCRTFADYNSKSIMQYPSYSYGCNYGDNTMLNKDGSVFPNPTEIQDTDVAAIKKLYKCT